MTEEKPRAEILLGVRREYPKQPIMIGPFIYPDSNYSTLVCDSILLIDGKYTKGTSSYGGRIPTKFHWGYEDFITEVAKIMKSKNISSYEVIDGMTISDDYKSKEPAGCMPIEFLDSFKKTLEEKLKEE